MPSETRIPQFIETLRRIGLDPDAREIADMLWLSKYIEADALETAPPSASAQADTPPSSETEPQPPIQTPAQTPVYMPGRSDEPALETALAAMPLRVPSAAALPGKLALGRALRPLKRRVPSRTRFDIDVEATVRRIAETDNWTPVWRPKPARWLDLAILVDQSPSMLIWQETVDELIKLLEQQNAFRNLRAWGVDTGAAVDKEHQDLPLYGQWKSGASPSATHAPDELKDPRARRLVLIVSDCVAPAWHDGRMVRMLSRLGPNALFSVVQMMPYRHWRRTALGRAESVFWRSRVAGTPNDRLTGASKLEWPQASPKTGVKTPKITSVKTPVITLEPDFLASWAKFLIGSNDMRIPGVLLHTQPASQTPGPRAHTPPDDLLKRLQRFHASASPTARLLALHLTAAPLYPPVMRLVQFNMLPQSRQIHLAEVFLSGLIRRVTPTDADQRPETAEYAFLPGVAKQLRQTALVSETVAVVDAVSKYIEKNQGVGRDFMGAIADPVGKGGYQIPSAGLSFARIKIRLLRRLGGIYHQLADDIESKILIPVKYPRRAKPLVVSKDEFKEVFKLDDNRRPLAYVSNDYKDNHDGTITDRATGLMWQQSGSADLLIFGKAQEYVKKLNQERFAGHDDWRLPNIHELTSLLEPKKQSNDLYIDPIFDKKQRSIWSSDTEKGSSELAWVVYFNYGVVSYYSLLYFNYDFYVRVVRAGQ